MPDSALQAELRDEIARSGPIPFSRFMEAALYHAQHGYYRRRRHPFGPAGDYFTAAQLQPTFGILIAQAIRQLHRGGGYTVVELGAGRGEMAEAFRDVRYIGIDLDRGALPERFDGVVFANEFFDALPVDVWVKTPHGFRQRRVAWTGTEFGWMDGEEPGPRFLRYLERYAGSVEDGWIVETPLAALDWLDRIDRSLRRGWLLLIDYGYTAREMVRFPQGTLMSYRRHTASAEVLKDPGARDITALVPFSALIDHAEELGWSLVRFQTLARTLLDAGEADQFAAVLQGSAAEQHRRKLQLKTLLFGMGDSFRVVLMRKEGTQEGEA